MDASELRVAPALQPDTWQLTLRASSDVIGEQDCDPVPLPFSAGDVGLFERALDLNAGRLRRAFSAAEIARLAGLNLLRRAPAPSADVILSGHDLHRKELRALVRGWLAKVLLDPLGARINEHFAALRAAHPGEPPILYLRLEFRPDRDLPLLRLPWELLHQHCLTKGDIHLGRYLRYDAVPGLPAPAERLQVLVLPSDPSDDALVPLQLKELERISEGLAGTRLEGRLRIEPIRPAGYRAAQEALHAVGRQPVILHFAGHGDFGWRCEQCRRIANTREGNPCADPDCGFRRDGEPSGYLAFTDPDTGRADWIGIDGLRNLLKRADVRLVVLNACKSATGRGGPDVFNGLAQQLMDIVPAVVATPFPLETRSAEEFARLLYRGLGDGLPLVEALHRVQESMVQSYPDEWYRPVLYLRSRQGDGGRLIDAGETPARPAVAPPSLCPDPETQSLSDQLREAHDERKRLLCAGAETAEVQSRILDLKRRSREGGRLRVGGFLLDGRYRLLEALRYGGFGTIFRAWDDQGERICAIKVLHGQYGDDRGRVERFFRGARQMAGLQHQGIVQVLDPRQTDEGHHFFVMEYLPGGDLRDAVRDGPLPAERALDLIARVGEALAFAHARGLVHRDVKPANIVLDAEGHPKLTDFDLVRAGDTTGGTRTGMLGTFVYAAPEQMQRPQEADARADIFGLGMTAVFLLLGADPDIFEAIGDPAGLIGRLSVPPVVGPVLVRAIAREPADRFDTMAAFCEALVQPPAPPGILHPARPFTAFRDRLKDGSDGPEMIQLPAGDFLMGSPDDEAERRDNEGPRHRVILTKPFALGRFAVTRGEFAAFVSASGYRLPDGWRSPGFEQTDDHPVVGVSWVDAVAYCEWLSEQTGAPYRLPSEAEWEYACRAGTGAPFHFGEQITTDQVNYDGNHPYRNGAKGKYRSCTVAVGSLPANPWGLHEMHGNVWEWCRDWYGRYVADEAADPVGPDAGEQRVCRGGGWFDHAGLCRSARRSHWEPSHRYGSLGLRLARGPEPE